MSQTTCTKQNIPQEKPKTKKYIVEAEEPKEGQEVSTGGVRDKGKMVSQFKNPIPYEDPVPTPVNKNTDIVPSASAPSQRFKTRIRDEVQELAIDVGRDIAYSLWDDFLKPFIRAKLAQAVDWFLSPPMNNTLKLPTPKRCADP